MFSIRDGKNLASSDTLTDGTLHNYVQAGNAWLQVQFGIEAPIYDPTCKPGSSNRRLHPYLGEILAQRRIWTEGKPKKEPCTGEIFDSMAHLIPTDRGVAPQQLALGKHAAVYDWSRLGLFTGSRLGEYGQSKVPKGCKWTPLPNSDDVPLEWRGKPLAFIRSDFTFYTKDHILVEHSDALSDPARVEYVHFRFRYDKSKFNFIIRKFRRIRASHLCPVDAALNILARAAALKIGDFEPLGAFLANGRIHCIEGKHMQNYMRLACVHAFPDPKHYLRLHIDRLVSHSLRVTAAVALNNAGVSVDDIAFRLRWNSDAVKLYLRDCYRLVGPMTMQAVTGAYVND